MDSNMVSGRHLLASVSVLRPTLNVMPQRASLRIGKQPVCCFPQGAVMHCNRKR